MCLSTVEFASFTPMMFSTLGGLGREATIFYSCLADLLSNKHLSCYSHILDVLSLHSGPVFSLPAGCTALPSWPSGEVMNHQVF